MIKETLQRLNPFSAVVVIPNSPKIKLTTKAIDEIVETKEFIFIPNQANAKGKFLKI